MSSESNIKNQNKFIDNAPILIILTISSFLNIYNIWLNGYANRYYAAGVYSMGQNLHAFFFNSFDSLGFITIDKPPLGLWIQVIFTKIFGFSGTVLILPQAIASVISVYLIYRIIQKNFSRGVGLVAAAVLALTPIYVAVSRNNTVDGMLILIMVLAANQTLLATEKASMKHLILAGMFIGLGFNIKMLQAYMIVPAIYMTYLLLAKQKLLKKILACVVSACVMVFVSLSWVMAVDLTPEEYRPYVGGSTQNSAMELATGYNGINRIYNGSIVLDNEKISVITSDPDDAADSEIGMIGFLRLYNQQNASQIAWFVLPALLLCIFMLIRMYKGKFKSNSKNTTLLFFVLCFISMAIYFSFTTGLIHRYYFATFAPYIAGLTGIGFYYLNKSKRNCYAIVFIPLALTQLLIHSSYLSNYYQKDWFSWVFLITAPIFAFSAIVMLIAVIRKVKRGVLTGLMCTLLILPAVWSVTPIVYGDYCQMPIAGTEIEGGGDNSDLEFIHSDLVEYLQENRDGVDYLAVTPCSMMYGAELILKSGQPVIALGGFIGSDTPVTLDEFKEMIENNEVKYAIVDDYNANVEVYNWIKENGTMINPSEYGYNELNPMRVYKLY